MLVVLQQRQHGAFCILDAANVPGMTFAPDATDSRFRIYYISYISGFVYSGQVNSDDPGFQHRS